MKSKKDLFTIPLVVLLALAILLAACSADGQELPSSQEQEPSTKQDPVPEQEVDPNKEVLTYAVLSPSFDREAVDKFNRSHDGVQIVVEDYYGAGVEEAAQGLERLRTEIAAGQVPDIIDLGYGLSYLQLAQRGYLEDLWPYIESDPDLAGNVVEAPLRAAEVDGGLYAAFGSVLIHTLVGSADQVGDRTNWTLEELRNAFSAMPEDSTIFQSDTSRETVAARLLELCVERYVDWEGTCSFDNPTFRSALEFVSLFPAREEIADRDALEVYVENEERLATGRQMLEMADVSLNYLQTMDARHGGRCAFIGYPTEDGLLGSIFRPQGQVLAMSAACGNKEAAWEFVRTAMMPLYNPSVYSIPIRKSVYDQMKDGLMRVGQEIKVFAHVSGSNSVPPMTEEDAQRFEDFLNSIDRIDMGDDALCDLVMDTCGPYFAGDKPLDDTLRLLDNRVSLYLNEQK